MQLGRLYIHVCLHPKHWYWGKPIAFCGCKFYDFGPVTFEYIPKESNCDREE